MARGLTAITQNLILALNVNCGYKILMSRKQFYGVEGYLHTNYCLANAVYDEERHKYRNVEMYSSLSITRIVMFLRDLWYYENGWELPLDNEWWNELRKDIDYGKYRS